MGILLMKSTLYPCVGLGVLVQSLVKFVNRVVQLSSSYARQAMRIILYGQKKFLYFLQHQMLKYLLLCREKKKNLIEFNLIALKNDNIFCILLDMENWCLNLIEEPNVLHLSILYLSFALSQNYYNIPFQFIATQKTFLITHCSLQFLFINSSL